MTYQDELEQSADHTAEALAGVVAAFISAGNLTAAALADLSLSNVLTIKLGKPIAPLGITRPTHEPDRLHKAATTLLNIDNATAERWQRLATAEAKTAAAEIYSQAIRRSRHVTGWRRGLRAGACQLCRWWSRDGQIWPADHPMPTHKGCTCHPEPITT